VGQTKTNAGILPLRQAQGQNDNFENVGVSALVADTDNLTDVAWGDNLLEQEGGDVGPGDGEAVLRQMAGDDASTVGGGGVE
jgi:hypothetical protein